MNYFGLPESWTTLNSSCRLIMPPLHCDGYVASTPKRTDISKVAWRYTIKTVMLSTATFTWGMIQPFALRLNATTIIPIVFALAGDPVATGLVASLSHPGGNVTGLSVQTDDVIGKRFDLLRQIVPTFRRLAVFANVESALVLLEVRDIQATARTLGVEVAVLEVRRAEDIEPVFVKLNGMADALYVCADPLVNAYRERMNALALAAHLPYARFARLCGTRGSHVLRAKHP
jgi:hypothetical protein